MENIKEKNNKVNKKTIKGVVVSNKMEKTLVVLTKRFIKDPKYGKYRTIEKKYKAHYEEGEYNEGDEVTIEECNPISKEKRFKIVKSS
ncbi:30S ribosomal protein S17 [Patescibacteria group bacterium]|nr:30S ribosomal protein S17 [Patescibacteria group bacterium]